MIKVRSRIRMTVLGALVGSTFSVEVRAQERRESVVYTVQQGDTCVAIATKFYGDGHRVDLIHDANTWMGPPPHTLHAGQQLVIPPKTTDPGTGKPDATLTRVRNRVEVTTTEVKPGKPNDPLFRGNRVATKESSAADITFRDETQVKLGESSLVVILGDSNGRAAPPGASDVTLVTGGVRAHLADLAGKRAAPPKVTTDSAVVALKDGEAQVTTDDAKTTRVAVYKGGSTVSAQKKSVDVNDGFGSKAETGRPPSPPAPLPPAPDWSASPPAVVVAQARVELAFAFGPSSASGPAAAEWHVQLARDAAFDDLVVDQRAPISVQKIEAKNLGPGSYFARVSAIDADHFEGKWSVPAQTIVARLVLDELPARRARIDVDGAGDLRCTLDDAPTTLPTEIDRDRTHAVACAPPTATTSNDAFTIPIRPVGRPRISVERFAVSGRHGFLRVSVLDETGSPVSHLRPSVDGPPDLTVGQLSPTAAAGVYVAPFSWSGPPRPTTLTVRVLDGAAADTAVAFDKEQTAKAPRPRLEVSAAGAGMLRGGDAIGLGFDVEARVAAPLGRGAVIAGASTGLMTLLPSREDLGAAGGDVRTTGTIFGGRLFGGYRYDRGAFAPYVTLGPELLRQRVAADGAGGRSEGREWILGGALSAGVELGAGGGAFFGEVRGRLATAVGSDSPSLGPSGVMLLLGYRIGP